MTEPLSSPWKLPAKVTIIEQIVGEGFAAEPTFIPTETKVWLVRELIKAGCTHFQVSNFGNPKIMPQFRDCEELYARLGRPEGVSFQAPALNMRALERVKKLRETGYGPDSVELLIATTDAFNYANVNKSTEEQWKIMVPMVETARDAGLKITGGIGGCWTCLENGDKVPIEVAQRFAARWMDLGVDRLTHCEGTKKGQVSPKAVYEYFCRVLDKYPDPDIHTFHLHDAYGWGVMCCIAAMQAGITRFEICLGGLQGGPEPGIMGLVPSVTSETKPPVDLRVAPAMGLTPTEDFVSVCEAMGVGTGFDVEKLLNIGRWLEHILGRRLKSTRQRWQG
jgi:hydroxymethylglutaryl-CoA lyase